MASPIVAIGKERNKEYMRVEGENCNNIAIFFTIHSCAFKLVAKQEGVLNFIYEVHPYNT